MPGAGGPLIGGDPRAELLSPHDVASCAAQHRPTPGPAGTEPTVDEALAKFDHLKAFGPTPEAFTFRRPFPHPGGPAIPADDRNACPV